MCRETVYDEFRGEIVCVDTGEVLEERIPMDFREWGYFDSLERDRGDTRMTEKVHDYGIHTTVDRSTPYGRKLERLNRLCRVGGSTKPLAAALELANRVLSTLCPNPGHAKEEVGKILRILHSRGMLSPARRRYVAAAATYAALKALGAPHTPKDVADAFGIRKRALMRAYMRILYEAGDAVPKRRLSKDKLSALLSAAEALGVRGDALALATRIATAVEAWNPRGLAPAALYVASVLAGTRIPMRDVAERCRVERSILRKYYRLIVEDLEIEVPM